MPCPAGTHRLHELQRRLTCAASAAEEAHWRGYEHANLSLSMHLSLCQVEERATQRSPAPALNQVTLLCPPSL